MKLRLPMTTVVLSSLSAVGAMATTAPAAQAAYAKPTIAPMADVNINLGLTQRVSVRATNATGYEWRIWTAAKGWTLLAKGGTNYSSINFTGEAVRHMGLIRVTAINGTQRTVSNTPRLRVWGISPAYPAARGTSVRTGGWQVSVGNTAHATDGYYVSGMQSLVSVTKLATPAARPWMTVDLTYRDTRNIEHRGDPFACNTATPDFFNISTLGAGQGARGYVCAEGLSATGAARGQWVVEARASETSYQSGPIAYFRGA